jgi:hypothetical protein
LSELSPSVKFVPFDEDYSKSMSTVRGTGLFHPPRGETIPLAQLILYLLHGTQRVEEDVKGMKRGRGRGKRKIGM